MGCAPQLPRATVDRPKCLVYPRSGRAKPRKNHPSAAVALLDMVRSVRQSLVPPRLLRLGSAWVTR